MQRKCRQEFTLTKFWEAFPYFVKVITRFFSRKRMSVNHGNSSPAIASADKKSASTSIGFIKQSKQFLGFDGSCKVSIYIFYHIEIQKTQCWYLILNELCFYVFIFLVLRILVKQLVAILYITQLLFIAQFLVFKPDGNGSPESAVAERAKMYSRSNFNSITSIAFLTL